MKAQTKFHATSKVVDHVSERDLSQIFSSLPISPHEGGGREGGRAALDSKLTPIQSGDTGLFLFLFGSRGSATHVGRVIYGTL